MNPTIQKISPLFKSMSKQQESIQEDAIKFYLRRPNKETIIVHSPTPIKSSQLLKIASSKMQINLKDLVLFHKGQKVSNDEVDQNRQHIISSGDILHVHDKHNLNKNELKIIFKPFECIVPLQELICILVRPQQKIGESLIKHLPLTNKMSFIESGRKLDLQKTYKQQLIQDDTVITITTFLPASQGNKKSEQIANSNSNSQQKSFMKSKAKQYEDLPSLNMNLNLQNKPLALRKSVSWNSSDSCHLMSFKKKNKSNIYKSMKISDGKEVVWESDGSGEMSSKKLRMKIPFKKRKIDPIKQSSYGKNQEEERDNEQSSQSNNNLYDSNERSLFSSQQKIQLKNQFAKLLFSDSLETRQQVTQLQPPQMENFDFMEETEEVEVGEMVMNLQQYDDESDQEDLEELEEDEQEQQMKQVTDLSQSIGKSRGQYVVPTMIPTRDFDMKDMSDSDEQQI